MTRFSSFRGTRFVRLIEEDRSCSLCCCTSPIQRMAFPKCGHTCCEPCAHQMSMDARDQVSWRIDFKRGSFFLHFPSTHWSHRLSFGACIRSSHFRKKLTLLLRSMNTAGEHFMPSSQQINVKFQRVELACPFCTTEISGYWIVLEEIEEKEVLEAENAADANKISAKWVDFMLFSIHFFRWRNPNSIIHFQRIDQTRKSREEGMEDEEIRPYCRRRLDRIENSNV